MISAKNIAACAAAAAVVTVTPAAFAQEEAAFDVTYAGGEVVAGETVEVAPENATTAASYIVPEDNIENWDFGIDAETGVLSVTPKVGLNPGSQLTLAVMAVERETNKIDLNENIVFTVKVPEDGAGQADQAELSYAEATVNPGGSVSIPLEGAVPEGTRFIHGGGAEGWVTDTAEDGTLTVTAPTNATEGAWLNANVLAVFPDNSTLALSTKVTATKADAPEAPAPEVEVVSEAE